jgi:hypothetical protein
MYVRGWANVPATKTAHSLSNVKKLACYTVRRWISVLTVSEDTLCTIQSIIATAAFEKMLSCTSGLFQIFKACIKTHKSHSY